MYPQADSDHNVLEYLEGLIADEAGNTRGPLEMHLRTKQAWPQPWVVLSTCLPVQVRTF